MSDGDATVTSRGCTYFGAYSHGELKAMADSLRPDSVRPAAVLWQGVADTLKEISAALEHDTGVAGEEWEGETSDAFSKRMKKLATSVTNASKHAERTSATLNAVAEAIVQAKNDMPDEPSTWNRFTDGVDDTVSGIFGSDDEDTRNSAGEAAHNRAVEVMSLLAVKYTMAGRQLKPAAAPFDDGSVWPAAPDTVDPGAIGAATLTGSGYRTTVARSTSRSTTSAKVTSATAPAKAQTPVRTRTPVGDSGVKGGVPQRVASPSPSGTPGGGTVIDASRVPPTQTESAGIKGGTGPVSGVAEGGAPGRAGSQPPIGPASGAQSPGFVPPSSRGPGVAGGAVGVPGGARPVSGGPLGSVPVAGGGRGVGGGVGRGGSAASAMGGPASARGAAGGAAVPPVAGGAYGGSAGGRGGAASARRATAAGGAVGRTPAGGAAGKPFTAGGSGLLGRVGEQGAGGRNASGVPYGGTGQGQRREKDRRERPDYLVEDEETWVTDTVVNPAVVGGDVAEQERDR